MDRDFEIATPIDLEPAAPIPQTARPAPSSGGGASLESQARRSDGDPLLAHYLADIRDTPVLEPHEEIELSKRIHDADATVAEALSEIPFTARRLHEDWLEIRAANRVTSTLSEPRRREGAADRSGEIDQAMEKAGKLLARRDRLVAAGKPDAATLGRIDRQLTAAVRRVDPRPEWFVSVHHELEMLRESAIRGRGAQQRVGLGARALASALDRVCEALADQKEAKDTFIRHNLRLVVTVAKGFRSMGVPFVDLIQEGNIGLVRAVEKFDYRQGCRFSTYGVWWIRQSCIRAIQNTSRTVRLPTNLHDKLLRYRRASASLGTEDGSEPGLVEIASTLGTTPDEVADLARYDRRPMALDEPLPGDESLRVGDRIEDRSVVSADTQLDENRLESEVPRMLGGLSPRERRVVEWRFGLNVDEPRTLQDIGDELGLSRERVRQIERGAVAKLREVAERRGLESLLDGGALA